MKKLSKRSLKYLGAIASKPEGYFGIIPWSTQCILVNEGLITEGERRYGIYTLHITNAGRAALSSHDD